jgi:beta-xylosidase
MITNPIVPGLHPDAAVIRVGDRYMIATSTFGWFATSMRSRAAALHPVAESAP